MVRGTSIPDVSPSAPTQACVRIPHFGERLRRLIANQGITQNAFADQFGMSRSQLYNWLSSSAPPLKKHVPALASFFGVSEQYMATGFPAAEDPVAAVTTEDVQELMGTELRAAIEALIQGAQGEPARVGWLTAEIVALHARTPWSRSAGPEEIR